MTTTREAAQPEVERAGSAAPLLTASDLPWLGAALFVAVALRFLWVQYVDVDPSDGRLDDSVFYHNAARVLADGGGYVNPYFGGATAHWPPVYPATVSVLYRLFGWHVGLAYGLNIAYAAATVVLGYILARRIFDWRVAYTGALILAFFPGQIYFSGLVLTETMFAMVFMLVLLLALVWTVEPRAARWWQVLVLGLLVGASALVRAEGAFLPFVLVALWACTVRPWRRVAQYAVLLSLGAALALTPWTIRNAIQLHEFIPLRANANLALAHSLDPDADRPAVRVEDVQISTSEGLRYQVEHPWEIPGHMSRKIGNLYQDDDDGITWIQAGPSENAVGWRYTFTPDETQRWSDLASRYFFAVGAAALVATAVCLLRRHRLSLTLIVPAAGWTLLFGFITPEPRFHFALGPVLAILAGAFAIFAWDAVRAAAGSRFYRMSASS